MTTALLIALGLLFSPVLLLAGAYYFVFFRAVGQVIFSGRKR